ncbi:NAD(P)H-binding protein [Actinoplanes sp. Pm04-4]|uniref:NAD(P)H-binding protein n=1 Tax=Paractinoplanes pyxinae TaxID=2997416 RepID=A0ABT4BCU2_9ACTN|nr:NAD(P)H-binding protein [Actinoplanes pyxinae]MCY1144338.1 NAD(P)H-binding protein [Actinoplanes pyxinae]
MNTVLVTGATGNVGALVVRELQARNATVRTLGRDFALPENVIDGVDRVYLCAPDGPDKVRREKAVIDAAASHGVERIVKLSAMHADPASALPTYRWHGEIEAHLRRSGLPSVILRPAFFMTNLLMVTGSGTLPSPTAGRRVAMIDIRDVAAVAAATLLDDGHIGKTYELTGPAAVTFAEVAEALSVRFLDLTEEQARPRFEGAGLPDWMAAQFAGVFALIRAGGFEHVTDHVRAITGRPARDINDFAAAFAHPVTSSA